MESTLEFLTTGKSGREVHPALAGRSEGADRFGEPSARSAGK